MARLRLKVELNKGGKGISLHKLAAISSEIQKFLKLASEDVSLDDATQWRAIDFKDGSVIFNAEHVGTSTDYQAKSFNEHMRHIMTAHESGHLESNGIRKATFIQYAKISEPIDIDEVVRFGLYSNGEDEPAEWRELSKDVARQIVASTAEYVEYFGAVQGVIHSLFKGANPPYFIVRDLPTQNLVKCIYKQEKYDSVVAALKKRDLIIHVNGLVRANLAQEKIERLIVENIAPAADFTDQDFEKFFGSAPELTGDLSTEEFIEKMRKDSN